MLALYYVAGRLENSEAAIKTLVCSVLRGEYLSQDQISDYSTSNLIPMLDRRQLQLVVQFVDDICAEARKSMSGAGSECVIPLLYLNRSHC